MDRQLTRDYLIMAEDSQRKRFQYISTALIVVFIFWYFFVYKCKPVVGQQGGADTDIITISAMVCSFIMCSSFIVA